MMKRKRSHAREGGPDATSRPPKRMHRTFVVEVPTSEEIHTSRQLQQLLTWQQDLVHIRHGLQSCKVLLDGILSASEEAPNEKLHILVEYLESTRPRQVEDEVPVYLPDIMEGWSMAAHVGNEHVMSAVAVVLALLLKVLATDVGLVPIGLGIGRTLLQRRQQELLSQNLSAPKGRDFILSPTLRLVREMLTIDGGTLSIPVFRARNYTLKSLARNMGLYFLGDGVEDMGRPSVRTNAVQVLLTLLKFLHVEAKRDLAYQKDIVPALFRGLNEDPPWLVYDILDTLKSSVVVDAKMPRELKGRILNARSLGKIAALYSYEHERAGEDQGQSVQQAAHEFLMAACTTSTAGVLRPEHGYYPQGVDADSVVDAREYGAVSLDAIRWMDKFVDEIPAHNFLLSDFIQTLRPWSNIRQAELLVSIFRACPELVANYFANKKAFGFESKLSATWIGYSSLIFNAILFDVPQYFGHDKGRYARLPPPTAVVLGNILPKPMSVKVMTRCLGQQSKLISFFAIRLLVLALEKLSTVLEMHREASGSSEGLWADAGRRLVDEFCQRIPNIKDVINSYRAMSDDGLLQRVTASRLLLLYHEVTPQAALSAKYDFSSLLSAAIKRTEVMDGCEQDSALRLMELENVFAMAKYSPAMRWFARSKGSSSSPFVTLLRLQVEKRHGLSSGRLSSVLDFVLQEHELVDRQSLASGLQPLLHALQSSQHTDPAVWAFLDNCAERCARSPIKYQEMLLGMRSGQAHSAAGGQGCDSVSSPMSPLMVSMTEQLTYLVSSEGKAILTSVAKFLSEYLGYTRAAGVDPGLVDAVLQRFTDAFGASKARKHLSVPDRAKAWRVVQSCTPLRQPESARCSETLTQVSQEQLEEELSVPVKAIRDNNALLKWNPRTAEELVEEGYAAGVVWLLASEHPSIRKEALTALIKMAARIKESSYDEAEQVWLLLSELVETSRNHVAEAVMPSTILAFVCRGLDVLKNPLHAVYPKLNYFLTRGPVWDLNKIPLVQDIMHEAPTEDDAYYPELSWLLSYLLESLRTSADVTVLHNRRVFEPMFSLRCNPYMGPNLRNLILRILYRATTIDGGSDTLITRFGVIAWLEAQKGTSSDADFGLYQALIQRLWKSCNQERIAVWSNASLRTMAGA